MKYLSSIITMLLALVPAVWADDKGQTIESTLHNLVEGEQINAKSLRESLKEALTAGSIAAEKIAGASKPVAEAALEQATVEAPAVLNAYIAYRRAQAEVGAQTSRSLAAVITTAAREIPTPVREDQ